MAHAEQPAIEPATVQLENSTVFEVDTPWLAKWHNHPDAHELIIVRRGRVVTRIDGGECSAGPGEVLHYPCGMDHLPAAQGNEGAIFQALRWRSATATPSLAGPFAAPDRSGRMSQLGSWIHENWPPLNESTRDLVHLWLAAASRELTVNWANPRLPWVERVRGEIRRRLPEVIELNDLAQALGISRYHLSHKFKAAAGLSPLQYADRLRVEQAKGLLLHTEWSLDNIAREVGFCDAGHLSRRFRRQFEENPGAFRRRVARSSPA